MRKLICTCSLLLVALCGSQAAQADTCNGATNNLVSNCGFESGSFSSWTGTTTTDPFSGIDTGDPFAIGQTPYQGTYEAYLGAVGAPTTLTQTLATTPGTPYSIEFALLNDTDAVSPYLNSFSVLFGGATLFSESDAVADGYTLYNFFGVATGTSTALSFLSENDDGDFELDSVSVVPTPEPSSLLLLGTGLLGGVGLIRRRLLA